MAWATFWAIFSHPVILTLGYILGGGKKTRLVDLCVRQKDG
jgi:hypothetical protein